MYDRVGIVVVLLLLAPGIAPTASAQQTERERVEERERMEERERERAARVERAAAAARTRAEAVERASERMEGRVWEVERAVARVRERAVMEDRRGWMGIAFSTVEPHGRMAVIRVSPGSPAAASGLTEGDTIVRWNGRDEPAAAAMESPPRPGEAVRLAVRRGRAPERTVTVVFERRPGTRFTVHLDSLELHADSLHLRLQHMIRDSLGPALRRLETMEMPRVMAELEAVRVGAARGFDIGARSVAGAEFAEVDEALGAYFGTDHGVLTLRVASGTPAGRAGLEPGDVVVSANGERIDDVGGLRAAVARTRAREVELEVVRRGAQREIRLRWD